MRIVLLETEFLGGSFRFEGVEVVFSLVTSSEYANLLPLYVQEGLTSNTYQIVGADSMIDEISFSEWRRHALRSSGPPSEALTSSLAERPRRRLRREQSFLVCSTRRFDTEPYQISHTDV